MKKNYCSLLFLSFAFSVFSQDADIQKIYSSLDEKNKSDWEQFERRKKELSAGLFSPIVFYGKFVDQNNEPVEGVNLVISAEVFNPSPSRLFTGFLDTELKSDKNGCFEYKGMGRMIIVQYVQGSIPKGYAILPNKNNRFYYGQTPGEVEKTLHQPDKNNPVIFRVRKKAPAVLSVNFFHELRGMQPDKDYYGDMFYEPNWRQTASPDNLTKINPGKFYPQVKVHHNYRLENNTTHIYSVDVEFLGDVQLQKGDKETLIAPEKGYTGKCFHVTYKVEFCKNPEQKKGYVLSDNGTWEPYETWYPTFIVFAKILQMYYARIEIVLDLFPYFDNKNYLDIKTRYRVNAFPDKRTFEDDSVLRREVGLKDRTELKKQLQKDFIKSHKSLSEILKQEKKLP